MQKNGYFQFGTVGDKLVLNIYPPQEGGTPVNQDELFRYLEMNRIENLEPKVISEAVKNKTEKNTVVLAGNTPTSYSGSIDVQISMDRMNAFLRCYPPSEGAKNLDKKDIIFQLKNKGVVFGIKEEIIDKWLEHPLYCTNIPIAKGIEAVNGKDAEIIYHFNTDRKAKPKLNEDGTVDFHQLDNIGHVKAGEALATLVPEDPGTIGTDVFGNDVKPIKVSRKTLKHGKNIHLTEDKLQMISDVDGHAILEDDKVFVSNVYEVPADVDNSTGDITYEGKVYVKGNVRSGFKIQASGDVEVDGVVEGATIISGGQIILKRGIQGMGKGILQANGNVVAKFIESANVSTDGSVDTESIINSDVSAKAEIHVHGKKGVIIGGKTRAGKLIEASNIGSMSGSNTTVEVGNDPSTQRKLVELKEEIDKLIKEKRQLDMIVDMLRKKQGMGALDEEKLSLLQKTTKQLIILGAEINQKEEMYDELEDEMQENINAMIKVHKTVHSGSKVIVCGEFLLIQKEYAHCRFVKNRGEVRSSPL